MKTKIETKIKCKARKATALILTVLLLVGVFSACGNTGDNQTPSSYPSDSTTQNSAVSTAEETTKQNVAELGFLNIAELSDTNGQCMLIAVSGYNAGDKSVWRDSANGNGILLQGGFLQTIYEIQDTAPHSYKTGRGPYAYNIVSNDGVTFAGDGSILITERVKLTNTAVIFKCQTHFASTGEAWLIPATMIDWSTADENYVDSNGNCRTKYFVK